MIFGKQSNDNDTTLHDNNKGQPEDQTILHFASGEDAMTGTSVDVDLQRKSTDASRSDNDNANEADILAEEHRYKEKLDSGYNSNGNGQ